MMRQTPTMASGITTGLLLLLARWHRDRGARRLAGRHAALSEGSTRQLHEEMNSMRHEENSMRLHVCMHRATCAWALVLGLVLLAMAGPAHAQPVDIPATWGGDFRYRPRLTGELGWAAGRAREERRGAGRRPAADAPGRGERRAERGRDLLGAGRVYPQRRYAEARPLAGRVPARPGHEQLRAKHQSCLRGAPLAQLCLALA